MHSTSLPDPMRTLVENELGKGESLRWAGRPAPKRLAMKVWPIALFGIFFTGFALFWIMQASAMNQHFPGSGGGIGSVFPLFGIPFLIIGLCMLLSPFWMMRKAKGTAYAITNRRAIIFDGGWSTHIRSFGPTELGQIERRQHADGSGDIILAKELRYSSGHYSGSPGRGGHYTSGRWHTREIGFFGIPDVKVVEEMLRDLSMETGSEHK